MASTIFLCRHGASEGNVCQRLLEKDKDQLTDVGKTQANLLGLHLAKIHIDEAWSSDYPRAMDTAKLVLQHNKSSKDLLICEHEQLQEINYGTFIGKHYGESFAHNKASGKDILEWDFPEGESFKGAGQRMLQFWKDLCERLSSSDLPKTVLIVSHSVVLVNFLSMLPADDAFELKNWSPKQDLKIMKNASYMRIDVQKLSNDSSDKTNRYAVTFVDKHISDHYGCLEQGARSEFGVKQFVKGQKYKEFSTCIQQ